MSHELFSTYKAPISNPHHLDKGMEYVSNIFSCTLTKETYLGYLAQFYKKTISNSQIMHKMLYETF